MELWWTNVLVFSKKMDFLLQLGILGFVFLFKIGEAFLGRMSIIFYKEIGFSKGDIAIYSKTLGWITTVIFTLLRWTFCNQIWSFKSNVSCRNINGCYQFIIYSISMESENQNYYLQLLLFLMI